MNAKKRVCLFGVAAGLAWSIAPGILWSGFQTVHSALVTLAASIVTGLLVSYLMYFPLTKYGKWAGFIFGALSLPLGAFVFGFFLSILQFYFGMPESSGWNAVECGVFFAVCSILSIFVIILLPAAITSTFLLRRFIVHGRICYKD